ncbi:hypothetical protein HUN08_12395 [Gordonia sp. X0973]|uniref:DUF7574 domain-containing protein n=1 Tax=Gordonia sp. X0973 TaxID=2742602 RepID=UPI000F532F5E|nr:hypothetical protein [Gordonia sp. X0973]QKT07895.1 hypothetical protein HUN08_12395 [Gordonia sp. X0973]
MKLINENGWSISDRLGLVTVEELNLDDEPWSFSIFGVFYDPDTGEFWTSSDSGCSCPWPWEFHTPDQFDGPFTKEQAAAKLMGERWFGSGDGRVSFIERQLRGRDRVIDFQLGVEA